MKSPEQIKRISYVFLKELGYIKILNQNPFQFSKYWLQKARDLIGKSTNIYMNNEYLQKTNEFFD